VAAAAFQAASRRDNVTLETAFARSAFRMSPQIETCRRWASSNRLQVFLLTVCIVRLWFMLLTGSFWTDETGTAFVVRLPGDASLSVAPQVPASIYYALPRAIDRLFGFSEISYRIPSVLLMGIAFFIIGRLAARLIDPGAAWFAVFLCFAMTDFNYYAVDARPYALGICVTVASIYFLIEWLDTARWQPALLFLLLGAFLWRVQLVFWAFYPVFAVYTLVRLGRVGWPRAILVYCLLALALIPVAFEALHILGSAKAHIIVPIPNLRSLAHSVAWKPIAFCLGLAWLAGWLFKWKVQRPASREAITLIVVWCLWMPLCLWAFSIVTGTVLFVPRYFSPALPGAALAATAAAALYMPRACWKPASAVLAVVGLMAVGHWNVLWPYHSPDNWRDGAAQEHLAALEPDTPVIAVSPFIEAQPPAWSPDYHLPGFLYAPLFVYPLRGKVYPFPFTLSPNAEQYAAGLVGGILLKRPRFIVYGFGRNALAWALWLSKRPELAGWSYTVARAESIETIVFDRPATTNPR
jgi:hypothetical protein